MNRSAILLVAAFTLLASAAGAANAKKAEDAQMEELKTAGAPEKKRFEAYLKARLAKINDNHALRTAFMTKESELWQTFWTKVRDERKLFEMRMTQQMLSTFQSLTSLEPAQRSAPIGDFEKMQAGVIKSFELQQKAKTADFFAARDAAWKEFAAAQEQDREAFVASAAADWQERKAELLETEAPQRAAPKKVASEAAEDGEATEEEEAPKPKKKRKAPAAKAKTAAEPEQHWH